MSCWEMYSAQERRELLNLTTVFSTPGKKKERYNGSSKAKAVVETHPDVFDLESTFIAIITRVWNYTPQSRMSRLVKKGQFFFLALLNKSDDSYCGHTQLRPKPKLHVFFYPNQSRQEWECGFSLRWQKWTRESQGIWEEEDNPAAAYLHLQM